MSASSFARPIPIIQYLMTCWTIVLVALVCLVVPLQYCFNLLIINLDGEKIQNLCLLTVYKTSALSARLFVKSSTCVFVLGIEVDVLGDFFNHVVGAEPVSPMKLSCRFSISCLSRAASTVWVGQLSGLGLIRFCNCS